MAEKLAQSIVKENKLNIEIISRGIAVSLPMPANEKSIKALESFGITLKEHVAQPFELNDIIEDTVILTMTNKHKEYLAFRYPHIVDIIFTLKGYIGESGDIDDPYGNCQEVYNLCANEINKLIKKTFENI